MAFINMQPLLQLLHQRPLPNHFQEYLKEFNIKGTSKYVEINSVSINRLAVTVNSPHGKEYEEEGDENEQSRQRRWRKSQLKLFAWVVIFYCFVHDKSIESMTQQDFQLLASIFQTKPSYVLQYEALKLLPPPFVRSEWTQPEQDLLTTLIQVKGEHILNKEWKDIAYSLFLQSEGQFFRQCSQCRQRWMNYLNPQLSKDSWTLQEDQLLVTTVIREGRRWSMISKVFKGRRNEHMVKNRYNTLVNSLGKGKRKMQERKIGQLLMQEIAVKRSILSKIKNNNIDEEKCKIELIKKQLELSSQEREETKSVQDFKIIQNEQIPMNSFSQYLEPLIPVTSLNSPEKNFAELFDFHYKQKGRLDCSEGEYKMVVEDVVTQLGCGHAQLLDMFFDNESIMRDESSWLDF